MLGFLSIIQNIKSIAHKILTKKIASIKLKTNIRWTIGMHILKLILNLTFKYSTFVSLDDYLHLNKNTQIYRIKTNAVSLYASIQMEFNDAEFEFN